MEYKHAREFVKEVFPDTKLPENEVIVIPEDIKPVYRAWCEQNGKEV